MGLYFNPGKGYFKEIKTPRYVDKSALIARVNETLGTEYRLSCVSRPRRFGKSYAAVMLSAYYDKSCDSSDLFDDLQIAGMEGYQEHRNKYNVMRLDIAGFQGQIKDRRELVPYIQRSLCKELKKMYPDWIEEEMSVGEMMARVVEEDGSKFIAIIDEWDYPIRDSDATPETRKEYLEFLRSLFKNIMVTDRVFAGAYMTGILPMKRDGSQSAISEFMEYSVIKPRRFADSIGFSEEEVRKICEKNDMDFPQMKAWYDGYMCGPARSIYNPNSVMKAVWFREFGSYWRATSIAGVLLDYINLDFDGLGKAVEDLLAGLEIPVETRNFRNDPTELASADDVLTLLIHFGYVTYDEKTGSIRIPNYELREEFGDMIRKMTHKETIARVKESDQLLEDTIALRADRVAAQIQKVHQEESALLMYNNEQALRAVVKLAYFTYRDHYIMIEELPSGKGFVDIAFLPKRYDPRPALLIELKYEESAEGAIAQIKAREYPEALKDYGSKILLVGISYDKEDLSKEHHCVIEAV